MSNVYFEILGFDNDSSKVILQDLASKFSIELETNSSGLFASGDKEGLDGFFNEVEGMFENKLIYEDICNILKVRLMKNNLTLSLAESYTGGQISSMLTKVIGISEVFLGGVVAYSIQSKMNILGVKSEIIEHFGVYSSECVKEMAAGARNIFKSDIAIATSGLASADLSNDNILRYPPGKGFICISIKDRLPIVIEENFISSSNNPRVNIIEDSSIFAIKSLLKVI